MTSKERILTAARLGKTDRVPVVPRLFEEWIEKAGEELFGKILKECDPIIGIDVGIDWHGIYLGREGQERLRVEKTSTDIIYIVDTPRGTLRWVFRNTGKTIGIVETMFKDESDIDKLLSIPYYPPKPNFDKVHLWRDKVGDDAIIAGGVSDAVAFPWTFFGDEEFLIRCATDMPLIKEMLKIGNERAIKVIEIEKSENFEIYSIIGAEIASESFTSPAMFRELISPYDKLLCETIRNTGGISLFHMHDKIDALLENLADIGMDILEPLEATPCGNVSLADAKRRIGDRVCLMGNIDEIMVMDTMDLETVERMAVQCIRDAGEGRGFILGGTSSGIFTPKIARAFLSMAEVSKSMRMKGVGKNVRN